MSKNSPDAAGPIWSAIDAIYAAGHQPQLWPQLLETLADTASVCSDLLDDALMIHLQQAMRVGDRVRQDVNEPALATLLDHIQMPFLVINRDQQLVYQSRKFSRDRYTGAGFNLTDEMLCVSAEQSRCIADVFAGDLPMAVLGPYQDWQVEEALEVLVIRIDAQYVMLLLVDCSRRRTLKAGSLRETWALTETESTLVLDLLDDVSYIELAQRRGVTENTIRSQVKQIFAKTGTNRRVELMQLMTSGPQLLQNLVGSFPPSYIASDSEHAGYHQHIQVAGGNQLGFAEFGAARGVPLLFMHNVSGSRLQLPVPEQQLLEQNIRLIVPDRPGVGLSVWRTKFSMKAWVQAICELSERLQLDRVLLVGHSMGGIYALACAALAPHRFSVLGLVSTMAELLEKDLTSMEEDMQKVVQLGLNHPRLMRPLLRLSLRDTANSYVDRRIGKLPRCDQALYRSESFYQMAVTATRENLRQNAQSMIRDFQLLSQPWDFDIASINIPVQIWHGDNDITSPLCSVRRLAGALQYADLTVIPGETHMLLHRHWQSIAQTLLQK